MSNFIKAHGLTIAQGGAIENAVLETLTSAPASLVTGRVYYDSTAGEIKFIKPDGGTATVFTVASKEAADAYIASVAASTGATLVGTSGTTGAEGEFSTTDGTLSASLESIVTAIDAEIKRAKTAEALEVSTRTSEVTRVEGIIDALKDGSTSTIADLDAEDVAQAQRLADLEELVDGDMGDFTTLTTDHKDTLVGAINEVDANADATQAAVDQEITDRETAITDLTTYTDTNFVNKTTSTLQSIVADVNMGGSLTVTGDLTVNGGNFVTEAEVVTFADNILTLNSNVTTGEATENAGLEVSRGDEGTLAIVTWNELNDYITVPVWDAEANEGAGAFVQEEVATKPYAEANFLSINAKIDTDVAGVQDELDITQAGAGLETDGTYVASTGANYISGATSLKAADIALDAQAKIIADGLAQEIIDRGDADTALDDRLTTVEEQVNGKIGDLTTLVNTDNDTGLIATNLVDAVNDVDADLTLEVARAQAAEAGIQGTITALKDGSTSTIADLDAKDAQLTTNLNTEISDRQAAILAEQTARENADATINQTITTLKGTSYDGTTIMDLVAADAAETARATGKETEIETSIANMKTAINAMYYSFTADVAATSFAIAHNLNSEFVNVQVWVYDDAALKWKNDIVAIEIVDNSNLNIALTESRKVKVIVNKIASLS